MNSVLSFFARKWLKKNVAYLTDQQQSDFISIYGQGKTIDEKHKKTINQVILDMPVSDLDSAMVQVDEDLKVRGEESIGFRVDWLE